ncbi:hypothetical protein [Nocardia brevicatena]|uniref:hypothetical protein n=1 Tax=Nocardia brevicatena TaxID=37327 RepID=UPI0012FA8F9A|nr:hypothetical protein [Nocardia brevicatena]
MPTDPEIELNAALRRARIDDAHVVQRAVVDQRAIPEERRREVTRRERRRDQGFSR